MKSLVLLLIIILLSIILPIWSSNDPILSITIIVPKKFMPYFDWLLDFPSWYTKPKDTPIPTDPAPSKYQATLPTSKLFAKFTKNLKNIHYNQLLGDKK